MRELDRQLGPARGHDAGTGGEKPHDRHHALFDAGKLTDRAMGGEPVLLIVEAPLNRDHQRRPDGRYLDEPVIEDRQAHIVEGVKPRLGKGCAGGWRPRQQNVAGEQQLDHGSVAEASLPGQCALEHQEREDGRREEFGREVDPAGLEGDRRGPQRALCAREVARRHHRSEVTIGVEHRDTRRRRRAVRSSPRGGRSAVGVGLCEQPRTCDWRIQRKRLTAIVNVGHRWRLRRKRTARGVTAGPTGSPW